MLIKKEFPNYDYGICQTGWVSEIAGIRCETKYPLLYNALRLERGGVELLAIPGIVKPPAKPVVRALTKPTTAKIALIK